METRVSLKYFVNGCRKQCFEKILTLSIFEKSSTLVVWQNFKFALDSPYAQDSRYSKILNTVFTWNSAYARKSASLELAAPFWREIFKSVSLEWTTLFSLKKGALWQIVIKGGAHLGITLMREFGNYIN